MNDFFRKDLIFSALCIIFLMKMIRTKNAEAKESRVEKLAKRKDRKTVHRIINCYIDALKQRDITVAGSYLFGSHAKDNASEWSDIDVTILTDKFIGDSFDFRFLLMKIAREIDADIEPHPFLVAEFNEDNPAAVEVLRTGEKIL